MTKALPASLIALDSCYALTSLLIFLSSIIYRDINSLSLSPPLSLSHVLPWNSEDNQLKKYQMLAYIQPFK